MELLAQPGSKSKSCNLNSTNYGIVCYTPSLSTYTLCWLPALLPDLLMHKKVISMLCGGREEGEERLQAGTDRWTH